MSSQSLEKGSCRGKRANTIRNANGDLRRQQTSTGVSADMPAIHNAISDVQPSNFYAYGLHHSCCSYAWHMR